VAGGVLRQAARRVVEGDAVLVDLVVIGAVGSRETDHGPGRHALVAAVHGVAEVALDGHGEQGLEEDLGRHAAEVAVLRLQRGQVGVLLLAGQLVEAAAVALQVLADGAQRGSVHLGRGQRQLVPLGRRAGCPRAAAVEAFPRAPRAVQLPVEIGVDAGLQRAGADLVGRNEPDGGRLDERRFGGVEEQVAGGGVGRGWPRGWRLRRQRAGGGGRERGRSRHLQEDSSFHLLFSAPCGRFRNEPIWQAKNEPLRRCRAYEAVGMREAALLQLVIAAQAGTQGPREKSGRGRFFHSLGRRLREDDELSPPSAARCARSASRG
jgi:hypothetical protein